MGHGGIRELAVTVGMAGAGVILAALIAFTPMPDASGTTRGGQLSSRAATLAGR